MSKRGPKRDVVRTYMERGVIYRVLTCGHEISVDMTRHKRKIYQQSGGQYPTYRWVFCKKCEGTPEEKETVPKPSAHNTDDTDDETPVRFMEITAVQTCEGVTMLIALDLSGHLWQAMYSENFTRMGWSDWTPIRGPLRVHPDAES